MTFKACWIADPHTTESPKGSEIDSMGSFQMATLRVGTTRGPINSRRRRGRAAGSAVALSFAILAGCATQPFTVDTARVAAGKGDPEAQYFLGRLYAKGDGVPQDLAKAAEYTRQSAAQGCASAQNDLGAFYAQGLGVPQNYAEALRWFRLAADQGDTLAEFSLGLSYSLARGAPTNMVESVKWFERAAEHRQLDAMLALGDIYLGDRGVRPNYTAASKWYKKAAAHNSAQAVNALGFIYEHGGFGVTQDSRQAVNYYRQAATAGDAKGQMNLGRMYLEGMGVQKDAIEAYKWLYLASRNGARMARHYLDELEGTSPFGDFAGTPLTEEQINEATRRAEKFAGPRRLE